MNRFITLLTAAAMATGLAACGVTPSTGNARERSELHTDAMDTLSQFRMKDASLQEKMDSAYAYAIFPDVTTAAVGVGGGHGRGEVYQGGTLIGYADISQGNIGLQLGAQSFAELVLFQNQSTLQDFQNSTFTFDARANAVAAASGAAKTADYTNGVLVFDIPQGGLMFQAAIGGQKFRYEPVGAVNNPNYNPNWNNNSYNNSNSYNNMNNGSNYNSANQPNGINTPSNMNNTPTPTIPPR